MKWKIIISLLFFSYFAQAQTQDPNAAIVHLAYYGDVLVHPGLSIGYAKPMSSWKSGKKQNKYWQVLLGADLNYYLHKNHHHALIIGPTISLRRSSDKSWFFQLRYLSAYHRSFVDGSAFRMNEAGQVKKLVTAGQDTFFNSLEFDFGFRLKAGLYIFTSLGVNARYPFNHALLKGLNGKLGFQYSL